MDGVPEDKIPAVLFGITTDLEEAIRDALSKKDIKFTGQGMSGVRVTFEDSNLIIRMADYLEFIEYGMPNPTSPEELEDWVRKKMLSNYNGKNKDKAVKAISKNLAEKITKFGPRPNPFLRPLLHQELGNIIRRNIDEFS